MKKFYTTPGVALVSVAAQDILLSSGDALELYDIKKDPYKQDLDSWSIGSQN